ncbi:hypothetical protein [Streptomyces sp. NPDC094468]|uniref:hypothetical protein n=1 Tax=Streptomyces sp. NPDC094468 TaxID=3366066 RepID=UPI00381299EB
MICGLCETQLEHGHLCPGCTLATYTRLDRMRALWEQLAEFLAPGCTGPQGRRSQAVEAPLPVVEDVLSLRAQGGMVRVLEDWHATMRLDRGWARPLRRRPKGDGVGARVEAAAQALIVNLEWMAAYWPTAGEFALSIRQLEGEVLSIVDPRDPAERGQRHGYCVALDQNGEQCGAALRLYPGETAMTCRWCRYVYQRKDWLRLAALQPDTAPETAEPVA